MSKLKLRNILVKSIFHIFLICISITNVLIAFEKEVSEISSILSEKITIENKASIAVVDFTDLGGNTTELGRFLAEEFSVAFAGLESSFEVVDRTHLKSIIKENKLSSTGLIDPSTARKLGKIAGVQALVTGTLTPFGESVRISIKVLDTETAKIIAAERGNIAKTQAITFLLSQGIESGQSQSSQPKFNQNSNNNTFPNQSKKFLASKKVGSITLSVKKIYFAQGQVKVAINVYNHLDYDLQIGLPGRSYDPDQHPSLIDNKGYPYGFANGLNTQPKWRHDDLLLELLSKANSDLTLTFQMPVNRKTRGHISLYELGSVFSLSLKYILMNPRTDKIATYQVAFIDIPANKPK